MCSLCTPCLPRGTERRTVRGAQCGLRQDRPHRSLPARLAESRHRRRAGGCGGIVDRIRREQLRRVRPQRRRARLAARACDSSVPSPRRITQSAACAQVVAGFLDALGGDRRELGVARPLEGAATDALDRREQEVAQDVSPRSRRCGSSRQRHVAVLVLRAQESELVLVAASALRRAGMRQQRSRAWPTRSSAMLVERDVFFQHRAHGRTIRARRWPRIRRVSPSRST